MYLNASAKNSYNNLEQSRMEFDFAQVLFNTLNSIFHVARIESESSFGIQTQPGFM